MLVMICFGCLVMSGVVSVFLMVVISFCLLVFVESLVVFWWENNNSRWLCIFGRYLFNCVCVVLFFRCRVMLIYNMWFVLFRLMVNVFSVKNIGVGGGVGFVLVFVVGCCCIC